MSIDASLRFLEAIYGALGPFSGVSEAAIQTAERRLGVRLPAALRTLYRVTGKTRALHAAHNRIVPADDLGFVGDHLVFYEENQNVVVWGVARSRLPEDDPPVDQGQPGDEDAWTYHPEFRSVSEFASAQGVWQAVQGGLPFVGVWQQPVSGRRLDEASLARALGPAALVTESMRAWLIAGGVAADAGGGYLGLATAEPAQFLAAGERLGIDLALWDYATLRDEPAP